MVVSNRWTVLLDCTIVIGLTQNAIKYLFQSFQCRKESNHAYSAFFVKFGPLAC